MRRVWSCGWWGKRGKNTWSGSRGRGLQDRRLHQEAMAGCGWVEEKEGGGGRREVGGCAQFVNAITVDLPSLTTESNQHCGGDSSA